jgi:hypothetical protein
VPVLVALVIAAAVTPTDPVLSSAIVKGSFADQYVSPRIRNLISAESGANVSVVSWWRRQRLMLEPAGWLCAALHVGAATGGLGDRLLMPCAGSLRPRCSRRRRPRQRSSPGCWRRASGLSS